MKANELRCGNYVNVPRKEQSPFRIDYFDKVKVYQDNGTYECPPFGEIPMHPLTWDLVDIDGIVLTPEILEKCGFKKSKYDESYLFLNNDGSIVIETDGSIAVGDDPSKIGWASAAQVCSFLHQLQNLYFALTGQELEVKL